MSDTPQPPPKTTLYLVRHGATAANELRPYVLQGNAADNPLSPTGEAQAAAVADLLAGFRLDAVYCSHMRRATQTATAIAARYDTTPTPLDAIHEIDVGQWEGLNWETIRQRYAEAFAAFDAAPGTAPYLGGESYANVLVRVLPVFAAVFDRHPGGRVCVVAHNVVNRAYLAHLLGLDINFAKGLPQSNCGVNVIEFDPAAARAAVVTLNANFHLRGVGS